MRISGAKILALRTDRARYRPGDTLRVRVFALKVNLAPAVGPVSLHIYIVYIKLIKTLLFSLQLSCPGHIGNLLGLIRNCC